MSNSLHTHSVLLCTFCHLPKFWTERHFHVLYSQGFQPGPPHISLNICDVDSTWDFAGIVNSFVYSGVSRLKFVHIYLFAVH